jgi:four helix bundle protein
MENNLYNKSYAFSIRVIQLCRILSDQKREFILSKQLLKSGTSIGANIAEVNGAISKADFSSKLYIAYKECLETKYWLPLLKDTGYFDKESFKSMYTDADELAKILYAIINKSRPRDYK